LEPEIWGPPASAAEDDETNGDVATIVGSEGALDKEGEKTGDEASASSASADAAAGSAKRGVFIRPSALPTQQGPLGILYDFNDGCRISLPESDPPWRVRIRDLDTGNILF
jgi:hypothetical protein